jgi:hypothetical protein
MIASILVKVRRIFIERSFIVPLHIQHLLCAMIGKEDLIALLGKMSVALVREESDPF